MQYRAIEAELWGRIEDVEAGDGFVVRAAAGAYGTLYEIECHTLWRFWRLHAVLSDLSTRGASWMILPCGDDEEEASDGVIIIHFWRDARDHVTVAGSRTGSPISQPAKQL